VPLWEKIVTNSRLVIIIIVLIQSIKSSKNNGNMQVLAMLTRTQVTRPRPRTQVTRPRPRPRTQVTRPRPRPRTWRKWPRPRPRTCFVSSRTAKAKDQGQGLTSLRIRDTLGFPLYSRVCIKHAMALIFRFFPCRYSREQGFPQFLVFSQISCIFTMLMYRLTQGL